jgi:predicted metal-dependent hydrolase
MLSEESLEFNLGYAAGFETTGLMMAEMFFDGCVDSLVDADPVTAGLWGWHLAEEFEHRTVAFDVYRELHGSWPFRVKMYFYQSRHLRGLGDRAAQHMRQQDEAAGRIEPLAERAKRTRHLDRRQARFVLPRLAAALLPWHDPRQRAQLPRADALLAGLVS